MANYIKIDWVVNGGAMLIVFLVTLIVFSFLSSLLAKQMKGSSLGPLDRSMGVVFGTVRGGFIVCTAYLGFSAVFPESDHPDFITEAKLRPMLQTGSKAFVTLVPLERLPLNLVNIGGASPADGVEALQEFGQDVLTDAAKEQVESLGATFIAVENDSHNSLRVLLNNGASLKNKNLENESIIQVAENIGSKEIIRILKTEEFQRRNIR